MRTSHTFLFVLLFIAVTLVLGDTGAGDSQSGYLTSMPPGTPLLIYPEHRASSMPDSITFL